MSFLDFALVFIACLIVGFPILYIAFRLIGKAVYKSYFEEKYKNE